MNRNFNVVMRTMVFMVTVCLAIGAIGLGQFSYLCSMTGKTGSKCCCPQDNELTEAAGPKLKRIRCCEVVGHGSPIQPIAREIRSTQLVGPDCIAIGCADDNDSLSLLENRRIVERAFRAPLYKTGPPLFVKNCSYLI